MNAIKLKDINYSSPTGYYKVKIISNCEWKGVKNLRLGISLGGRNHEEDRLFALVEWAGARFESVHILVADSVQRHNIMFDRSIDEISAREQAMAEGDSWIARNKPILSALKNHEILRFDDLESHPEFAQLYLNLQLLFLEDFTFRTLIERDINGMWARKVKNSSLSPEATFDKFYEYSKNYILEELAIMDIFGALCPGVEAYPGKFLNVVTSPERFAINGFPERLMNFPLIEVDFTRNKAFAQNKVATSGVKEFVNA